MRLKFILRLRNSSSISSLALKAKLLIASSGGCSPCVICVEKRLDGCKTRVKYSIIFDNENVVKIFKRTRGG